MTWPPGDWQCSMIVDGITSHLGWDGPAEPMLSVKDGEDPVDRVRGAPFGAAWMQCNRPLTDEEQRRWLAGDLDVDLDDWGWD